LFKCNQTLVLFVLIALLCCENSFSYVIKIIIFDGSKIANLEKWLKIIILLKNMKSRESYADQEYIFIILLASLVMKIYTVEIYEKLIIILKIIIYLVELIIWLNIYIYIK